eukprot:724274_1
MGSFTSTPSCSTKFKSHMTFNDALKLRVGDKIDHRCSNGLFLYATIREKEGTKLKIHYDKHRWSKKRDIWSNFKKEIYRFAKPGSISRRPAHRFKQIKQFDRIDINPIYSSDIIQQRTPGWKYGSIFGFDKMSGQVLVQVYDGMFSYWTHLDNHREISEFNSKSLSFKDLRKKHKNNSIVYGYIRQFEAKNKLFMTIPKEMYQCIKLLCGKKTDEQSIYHFAIPKICVSTCKPPTQTTVTVEVAHNWQRWYKYDDFSIIGYRIKYQCANFKMRTEWETKNRHKIQSRYTINGLQPGTDYLISMESKIKRNMYSIPSQILKFTTMTSVKQKNNLIIYGFIRGFYEKMSNNVYHVIILFCGDQLCESLLAPISHVSMTQKKESC